MRYGVALLTLLCGAGLLLCLGQLAVGAEGTVDAAIKAAPSETSPIPVIDANYRIAEEDVIRLDVWGEEELRNFQLTVTPGGKVNMPYLGEMQAAGLTQSELTKKIADKFEELQILLDPKVQLTILMVHRPAVRVLGEVNRPGEVIFKDGDRLLDAVAVAGSYTTNAWLEKATLTHKGSKESTTIDLKKVLHGDMSQNYELQKGDTIYIPAENYENKFYVLGQVLRPAMYPLKDNTTVLAAISMAGGATPRASMRGTVVVRGYPDKPQRIKCNISRLLDKADLSQDIQLQSGDVVLVPETNKPNWGEISQILGTVLNLTYLRRYGLF